MRVSAFLKDHGSELQALFPPPMPITEQMPLEQTLIQNALHHVEHVKAKQSPILNECVLTMEASAFPPLPKQPQSGSLAAGSAFMAAMLHQGPPANFLPLIVKKSKQRVKALGRSPNVELYAVNASDVPSLIAMPQPNVLPIIPDGPSEHTARAAYIQAWAPLAHTFRQGTQPWHALRAATCTASNIAYLLGLRPESECSASFLRLFGVQADQVSRVDSFLCLWGMRHELNGVASVLDNFQTISSNLASKLNLCFPPNVQAHEQGLLFVPHAHTLLQGTVFGTPCSPYAIAASPDAKLVAGGSAVLLEVKCACPFTEKDDGRGWVWCPCKKAVCDKGVNVKHFVQCQVQMLAAHMSHCLLVGWEVEECHVVCVPFDASWSSWCRQMLCMLSSILVAAAPLSGGCPRFSSIPQHKKFVEHTQSICESVPRLCSVKSVKGAVISRWV